MCHLQSKNEKVTFQQRLKDNTYVEFPSKQKGLKMCFVGKHRIQRALV